MPYTNSKTEDKIMKWLKNVGYEVQSPDWIITKNNKSDIVEVKEKDTQFKRANIFNGRPAHGLDLKQIKLRDLLRQQYGLRTILVIVDNVDKKVYAQYIDVLEQGEHHDTGQQAIRVYPIDNFKELTKENITSTIL